MEPESKPSTANRLGWVALALVVIGALNWLLIGVFQYNLVAAIFAGPLAPAARITYILVGVSGLYLVFFANRFLPRGHAGMTSGGRVAPPHAPRQTVP
jgi:hypothetical protein